MVVLVDVVVVVVLYFKEYSAESALGFNPPAVRAEL